MKTQRQQNLIATALIIGCAPIRDASYLECGGKTPLLGGAARRAGVGDQPQQVKAFMRMEPAPAIIQPIPLTKSLQP